MDSQTTDLHRPRDHYRLLGVFFLVWAVVQVALAIGLEATGRTREVPYPLLYWISTALVVAAYVWTGLRLRLHDPRVRVLAIVLSVFALLSFPLGTALGAYGLWALMRRRREAPVRS